VERAVRHRVVLVYPMISGRLLNYEKQESLRRHVREGGCLLATQVLGDDLKDLFGYDEVLETRRRHYEVKLSAEHELTRWLVDARERTVRLGNPDHPETWIGTQYYTKPEETLASYQDGQAAWITKKHPGGGRAMALGFDLGFFILKCQNDRDEEASRDYVNAYEPSVDVWLRLLRHVYQEHEPLAVTVDTVPDGKRLSAVMSFDIDYVKSLQNLFCPDQVLQGLPRQRLFQRLSPGCAALAATERRGDQQSFRLSQQGLQPAAAGHRHGDVSRLPAAGAWRGGHTRSHRFGRAAGQQVFAGASDRRAGALVSSGAPGLSAEPAPGA
jgi:hypothetical protein